MRHFQYHRIQGPLSPLGSRELPELGVACEAFSFALARPGDGAAEPRAAAGEPKAGIRGPTARFLAP